MKLVSFKSAGRPRLGAIKDGAVVDLALAAGELGATLPDDMMALLQLGEGGLTAARELLERADPGPHTPSPWKPCRPCHPCPGRPQSGTATPSGST